jgi:hypothetical protein
MSGPAIIVVLIALVGTVAVVVWMESIRRAEAMRRWATEQDLKDLKAAGELEFVRQRLTGFPKVFKRRSKLRAAWATAIGDVPMHLAQVTEIRGGGQHTQRIPQRMVVMSVPDSWPHTSLTGEGLLSLISKSFGGQDIQLDDEDFNRRWVVKSDDEQFALLVLCPEVQVLLRASPRTQMWVIEGGQLLMFERGAMRPADAERMLKTFEAVRAAIPDELDAWVPVSG